VANLLYGKMNADEYRNYILGFIFFKFLSEKQEKYSNELLAPENKTFLDIKDDTKYLEILKKKSQEKLGYFLDPRETFSYLVDKGNKKFSDDDFILEDLKKTLNDIENTSKGTESEEDFAGLFNDLDLDSNKLGKGPNAQNALIVEVMTALGEIDFDIENSNSDILGDAYEYLISKFASGAGKSAGEFYTPAQVSRLLSTIVSDGRERIKSVYDPTCGSGSLLLKIGKMTKVNDYFGQENNPTTHNLSRMNMILRGIHFRDFDIRHGDTLTDDQFRDKNFEVIVANPPFSLP
jgi:type I restriction enzyme M protein